MAKFIGYLLIGFSLNIACTLASRAATIPAANCTSSAIQRAINAASDGDTIIVPSCASVLWSSDITIPNTKGITLQGAGSANTQITTNGHKVRMHTSLGRKPVRITGFRFKHTDKDPDEDHIIRIDGTAQDWRIDNNIFDADGIKGIETIFIGYDNNVDSFTYGLIDNNQFINRNDVTSIRVSWPRGEAFDRVTDGDWIWSQPAQRGTAQAVYIEDNIFSGTGAVSQVIDSRWGAKYVLRYNTIHNPWISTHSGCTDQGRDPVWTEVYKNTFTDDGNAYEGYPVEMRSTSGVVWGNTSSSVLRNFSIKIDHERSGYGDGKSGCDGPYGGKCDGRRSWDENKGLHGYKCLGQPGWGPPQASDMRSYSFAGVFNWGNSNGGSAVDMEIDGAGAGYVSEHLQFGREIFNATNMVIGPLGRRPSTCSSGASGRDIYVANDNPNAPVIYQCSATNTWTKHWEPYTYPHPLRRLSPPKQ